MSVSKFTIGSGTILPKIEEPNPPGEEGGNVLDLEDGENGIIQSPNIDSGEKMMPEAENQMKPTPDKVDHTETLAQTAAEEISLTPFSSEKSFSISPNYGTTKDIAGRFLGRLKDDDEQSTSQISELNTSLPALIDMENSDPTLRPTESIFNHVKNSGTPPLHIRRNSTRRFSSRTKRIRKHSVRCEIHESHEKTTKDPKLWRDYDQHFVWNPIKGTITPVPSNNSHLWKTLKVVDKRRNQDRINKKVSLNSTVSEMYNNFVDSTRYVKKFDKRNPITGEGIHDDTDHYTFTPRGIRVMQPPGGTPSRLQIIM